MLKEHLQDTWIFFKLHYLALSAIILPIVVPADILVYVYHHFIRGSEGRLVDLVPFTFKLIINPFYSVGVVFYIFYIIKGEKIDTKTAWMLGVKYWAPFFLLTILMGTITLAGLMMLIIPGLIFAVRFSFSEFDLLLENTTPMDALKNSWQMTRPVMAELFAGFAVISAILFLPYFLFLSVLDVESALFKIFDITTTIVYSVLEVFFTVFAFRVYDHAREERNKVFDL